MFMQRSLKPIPCFVEIVKPAMQVAYLAHIFGAAAFDLALGKSGFEVLYCGHKQILASILGFFAFKKSGFGDETFRN